jgi:hypothetical protein
MGQKVQREVWIAADGTEFLSQSAMIAHEARASHGGLIQLFLQTVEYPADMSDRAVRAQMTRVETIGLPLLSWLEAEGLLSPAARQLSDQFYADEAAKAEQEKQAAKAAAQAAAAQAAPAVQAAPPPPPPPAPTQFAGMA